jgi:hypothetical protein
MNRDDLIDAVRDKLDKWMWDPFKLPPTMARDKLVEPTAEA